MKIIGKLECNLNVSPNKLTNLDILNLNAFDKSQVELTLKTHQMEWDCWMETASNDNELKLKLKNRGCNVPSSHQIIHKLTSVLPQNLLQKTKTRIMTRRV